MKIPTFNGCAYSKIAVIPAKWNTVRASIKKPWKIHYRFYDPVFRKDPDRCAKQFSIKSMNDYKDLQTRQAITKGLIEKEEDLLKDLGYNPVTGQFMACPGYP